MTSVAIESQATEATDEVEYFNMALKEHIKLFITELIKLITIIPNVHNQDDEYKDVD